MSIITKTNCATTVLGTGTRGCRTLKAYIQRRFLLEKGYKFDKNLDTLDEETINELIQKFILVPLPNDLGAESSPTEPVYETIQGMDIPVKGMIQNWKVKFAADKCLGASLDSLKSKNWDLLEVDENGSLNAVETKDGFIKGFDMNLVINEGMMGNDGTVGAKHTLRIQLTLIGSKEYNTSWATIAPDEVDWLNLQGVDEIVFEKTAGGKLKATFACDNSSPISGLTTAKLRAVDTAGEVVVGFAVAEDGNGLYTISGLTPGTDYKIYSYDAVLNTRTVVLANYFYKSNDLKWTA